MRTILLISAVTLLFPGCSEEEVKMKEPITMAFNNTELNDWGGEYSTKQFANAHSGKVVAFVDSANVYSMGYSKTIENISNTKFDSIVFSYWAYCISEKAKAQAVITIDNIAESKSIYWAGNFMEDKVKEYNKWVHISETFMMPPNVDPKCNLKLYIWNKSKEEILLDDFKVEFY